MVATDASLDQLANRQADPGIGYTAAEATATGLADGSIDLVTVAQALHWFDLEPFRAEVRRVLVRGGALVAWTYDRFRIDEPADEVMTEFAEVTVGPYWPPQRRHVDARYETLDLELEPIQAPAFGMRVEWDLAQLLAYVGTWSAVQRFRKAEGADPISGLEGRLAEVWGHRGRVRTVRWSLAVIAGRV